MTTPRSTSRKPALLLASQAGKPKSAGVPRSRGRDDAFAGDVVESSEDSLPGAKAKMKDTGAAKKVGNASKDDDEPSEPAGKKTASKKDSAKASARQDGHTRGNARSTCPYSRTLTAKPNRRLPATVRSSKTIPAHPPQKPRPNASKRVEKE